MRPLLGTFVEVGVCGLSPTAAAKAVARAFARIGTVEAKMSAHNPASDLGRLFRAAPNTALKLHPWTIQVIAAAMRLHDGSNGAFDITVGNLLARRRLLPSWGEGRKADGRGNMKDIELLSRSRLRVNRPIRADLGGIAKGFAVDCAAEALLDARPTAFWVNAGGDLRIHGDRSQELLVRDPRLPTRILKIGDLRDGAVATSGSYFNRPVNAAQRLSPLIDGRTGKQLDLSQSITVIASSCMWADGLTKVLALDPVLGARLLDSFSATALALTPKTDKQPSQPMKLTIFGGNKGTRSWTRTIHPALSLN